MTSIQCEYIAPSSLDEALRQLTAHPQAMPLAGGHSLIPAIRNRRTTPSILVDLGNIAELTTIERTKTGGLRIGATTPYDRILSEPLLQKQYTVLREALHQIGDPQVRNRGTLGGALAYNNPASDLTAVALSLEAEIQVANLSGRRSIPADKLFTGPFRVSLKPAELITAVIFPPYAPRAGSAYVKFKHPASGYAICGVAVFIDKTPDGKIDKCRVALTGATDYPVRLLRVETALTGKPLKQEHIIAAVEQIALGDLPFRDDPAASAEYRAHLTVVLTERSLLRLVQ